MTDPTASDSHASVRLLKALADGNRLRILALLARGELCVCHIADALGLSQPNASQHLNVLRGADVVVSERRGNWMYYRLSGALPPAQARILAAVVDSVPAPERPAAAGSPCR